jgi:hypothetical protein
MKGLPLRRLGLGLVIGLGLGSVIKVVDNTLDWMYEGPAAEKVRIGVRVNVRISVSVSVRVRVRVIM